MNVFTIKSKFLRNLFDQNTYVLTSGDEAVIIDAGAEVSDIEKVVSGKKVLAVLITHIHFDHVWNLESYIQKFNPDIYILKGQENRFSNERLNASFMIRKEISIDISNAKIKYYSDNLKIGKFDIKVIKTPGHTEDGVSILIDKKLFSGDTLFDGGIGRTDLDDSSDEKMLNSLKTLKFLDFDVVYPGHYGAMDRFTSIDTIDRFL